MSDFNSCLKPTVYKKNGELAESKPDIWGIQTLLKFFSLTSIACYANAVAWQDVVLDLLHAQKVSLLNLRFKYAQFLRYPEFVFTHSVRKSAR